MKRSVSIGGVRVTLANLLKEEGLVDETSIAFYVSGVLARRKHRSAWALVKSDGHTVNRFGGYVGGHYVATLLSPSGSILGSESIYVPARAVEALQEVAS